MKKKPLTFLLISGVILIWALILWRIAGSIWKPKEDFPQGIERTQRTNYSRLVEKDTLSLHLNYPDPFLKGTVHKDALPITVQKVSSKGVATLIQPIDMSFVKYEGLLSGQGRRNKVVLISIHGKEEMLEEGKAVDGIKIIGASATSIKISFHGKTYTIQRN